jgi:hypothetical protein
MTDDHGSAESFNLEREAVDHYIPGQVFLYTTPTGVAAGMRLLEASEHSFVALIGPYFDPIEAAMVVTVLEGTCEPGRLQGEFHTRRRTLHRYSRRERFASRVNTGAPRSNAVGERVWSPYRATPANFFASLHSPTAKY